jgi:hypothetical protein
LRNLTPGMGMGLGTADAFDTLLLDALPSLRE